MPRAESATLQRMAANLKLRLTHRGWRNTGDYAAFKLLQHILVLPAIKKRRSPSLRDMFEATDDIYFHAQHLFEAHFPCADPNLTWPMIGKEFEQIYGAASSRALTLNLPYPSAFALEKETALLLYAMARLVRPETIVETGIANGWSSYVLLNALNRNAGGALYSIDVAHDVGRLVDGVQTDRWQKLILDGTRAAWRGAMASMPPIDLFVHDSDHSYAWQAMEYHDARPHMGGEGVLASDDADASFAFLDFAKQMGRRPVFLIEKRKVLGLLRVDDQASRIAERNHKGRLAINHDRLQPAR